MRRVLIEQADGAAREVMARTLQEAGFHVDTCDGPDAAAKRPCPLVEGGECDLAHDADVIVCGLHVGNRESRAVLHAHEVRLPGTPVVVEASRWQAAAYPDAVRGARILEHPVNRETLVQTVRDALTEG
jgi:DNA-binding NtrC family response regulator